jgi:hypothetical protein
MEAVADSNSFSRVALAVVALIALTSGCAGTGEMAATGALESRPVEMTPTTLQVTSQVPAGEQERADRMFAAAMSDGEYSTDELERAYSESVACTVRAGFEAEVLQFDPDYREFASAVMASGPMDANGEDAASLTLTACQAIYWDVARVQWEKTLPASSGEEAVRLQQERNRNHLACLANEGYVFDDLETAIWSDEVPLTLLVECGEATSG